MLQLFKYRDCNRSLRIIEYHVAHGRSLVRSQMPFKDRLFVVSDHLYAS